MKNILCTTKYLFVGFITLILLNVGVAKAQEAKPTEQAKHKHNIKEVEIAVMDSSIIRKGTIDLKEIDKNKDGKVFQDQMDWNVISDKGGNCPLCKMPLVEVSLEDARKNLVASGYKAKVIKKNVSLKRR